VLDRWAISELHATVLEVDAALEDFDSLRAGRRLARFIDDLSNWYVRRSRRRFWDGDPSALATLHECLGVLCRLMAPFTPFLADALWQRVWLAGYPEDEESVHLAAWPQVDGALVDEQLGQQVQMVRRIVELGRAARASSAVKTRQPLARALVAASGFGALDEGLKAQIADELNVSSIESLAVDLVDVSVKPNFRALGKRFGSRTPLVAKAVATAGRPEADGSLSVLVDGEQLVLSPDELIVTETPRAGWAVASESGLSVALDLEITPELRRAGVAREVIRLLQDGRKRAGLDVSDRIEAWWSATGGSEAAQAVGEHAQSIATEVLAVAFTEGRPPVDLAPHTDEELGLTFWLRAAGS
jgi:isoleucyl-tRNA synthetase